MLLLIQRQSRFFQVKLPAFRQWELLHKIQIWYLALFRFDSCSAINSDGTLLATFSVAFANKCDASNVISVSTSPNETFVLTDYNDGLKDEYALVKQADDYDGSLYLMTCDVSPKGPGCDITGKITIATSLDGSLYNDKGVGNINLTVKAADGSAVATAVTDSNGNYTLADIPVGEYTMLISGETTIDRKVTLVVSNQRLLILSQFAFVIIIMMVLLMRLINQHLLQHLEASIMPIVIIIATK